MTAVIPVLLALEPVVAPFFLKLIDKVFPKKSGPVKFPTAVSLFQALIEGLVKAGTVAAGSVPDQPTVAGWVQQLVNALNEKGELKGPDTIVVPPFVGTVSGPQAPSDTIGKDDARSILRILESIAPTLGVK